MINKENSIFQGWCALTVSSILVFRAVMCAVFPFHRREHKAFPSQHSLYFYNKTWDLGKNHKMKPGDCDQISVPHGIIISVCQKHCHPTLGWNWWSTLHCDWGIETLSGWIQTELDPFLTVLGKYCYLTRINESSSSTGVDIWPFFPLPIISNLFSHFFLYSFNFCFSPPNLFHKFLSRPFIPREVY